jgi:hypothetical protein
VCLAHRLFYIQAADNDGASQVEQETRLIGLESSLWLEFSGGVFWAEKFSATGQRFCHELSVEQINHNDAKAPATAHQ